MRGQNRNKKKVVIGITGSFGSGKTTVARYFKSLGACVFDADTIAHKIIQPGSNIYKKIVDAFGCNILKKNKDIDRDRLARIVFDNKDLLNRLNKIMHPKIIKIMKERIKNSPKNIIVLDVPLLVEAGLRRLADKLIVVKTTRQKQIERILKYKRSLKKTDILKRIKHQMPISYKVRLADFVIDNSKTLEETKKQVGKIRRLLWKNQI